MGFSLLQHHLRALRHANQGGGRCRHATALLPVKHRRLQGWQGLRHPQRAVFVGHSSHGKPLKTQRRGGRGIGLQGHDGCPGKGLAQTLAQWQQGRGIGTCGMEQQNQLRRWVSGLLDDE
jgi:hypothetical protein